MIKFFRKSKKMTFPAKKIREGDVVTGIFEGRVLSVVEENIQGHDFVRITVYMPKPIDGSRKATITGPPDKPITIIQK